MTPRSFFAFVLTLFKLVTCHNLIRDRKFLLDLDSITCDFEGSDICGYTQSRLDNFDWTRNSGQTTTSSTGPIYDHTLGRNKPGHYMYTEASYKVNNDIARLTSPLTSKTGGTHSIEFFYHMYGYGIGTLNVYVTDGRGNLANPDFTVSGDQGKSWLQGCVDVADPSLFSVVFEGVIGGSHGDIAIDDVKLNTGTCLANGIAKSNSNAYGTQITCFEHHPSNRQLGVSIIQNITRPFPYTATDLGSVSNKSITCDFESKDLCGYNQDRHDDFDWSIHTGSTSTSGTGPQCDHTLGQGHKGHYMYIESSYPNGYSDTARLVSPTMKTSSQALSVGFFYCMYGHNTGDLKVYVDVGNGTNKPSFKKSGDIGKEWHFACVDVPANSTFKIIFEGTVGFSDQGDIAIDDVTYQTGTCSSRAPSISAFPSIAPAIYNRLSCNFDISDCSYSPDPTGDINWTRHAGSTITANTGPSKDHTTPLGSGYYLYVESSAPAQSGDKARVRSPYVTLTGGQYSVSFWYHMYGVDIGTLNVYVEGQASNLNNGNQGNYHNNGNYYTNHNNQYYYGNHRQRADFVVKGNQSDLWKHGCVDITDKPGMFRLVFEAIRGDSYKGDIAIDDIELLPYNCTVAEQISKSKVDSTISSTTTSSPTYKPKTSSSFITVTSYSSSTQSLSVPVSTSRLPGTWSKWFHTKCSVTCGNGTKLRIRQCSTGHLEDCLGNSTSSAQCFEKPCQAGTWSAWYNVECPVTCGLGTSIRIRQCSSGHVEDCIGNSTEQITCNKKPCPKDGFHCLSAPCQNGATCEELPGTFNCFCLRGFVGPTCADDFDECSYSNTCSQRGSCINTHGNFTCVCQNGFTGHDCGTPITGVAG